MSDRKRFTAEMLTHLQKIELRAELAHPGGSPKAKEFAEKLARAKQIKEPEWLAWVANQPFATILDLLQDPRDDAARELPTKAVDEAVAILRSASVTDIDWMKEPLSERERTVRAKILETIVLEAGGLSELYLLVRTSERDRAASDIRAAFERAEGEVARWREVRRREAIERAIRSIEG
jgi:hypothetical protein